MLTVFAAANVPYQSMVDEATGEPSQMVIPRADPVDEKGPNVMTPLLEQLALLNVDAGPNDAVTRE